MGLMSSEVLQCSSSSNELVDWCHVQKDPHASWL
jgi:hypothetical protein